MRTRREIQVLEHAVIVVHHAGIVAVDQYLRVTRCVHDAEGAEGVVRNNRVVPVRAVRGTVQRIAVHGVGAPEVKVKAPTGTIAVRPVPVRRHARQHDIGPWDNIGTDDVRTDGIGLDDTRIIGVSWGDVIRSARVAIGWPWPRCDTRDG
jgi:hypothetical protein